MKNMIQTEWWKLRRGQVMRGGAVGRAPRPGGAFWFLPLSGSPPG